MGNRFTPGTGVAILIMAVSCNSKSDAELIKFNLDHNQLIQNELLKPPFTKNKTAFANEWLDIVKKYSSSNPENKGRSSSELLMKEIRETNERLKFWGFPELVREP